MVSLTFHGGVNEIGGNKILLQDKDTKVFLDFGKSFSRRATYFEEYLNPRTSNGIVDFLTMGLVPDIKGVYRDDLMAMAERKPQEPDIDAVLLTHAHADHADYISFLHEDIPIHMGSACHLMLKALSERASRSIEKEILDYKPRPYSAKDAPIKRRINEFRTGDKFKIGSLEVEPIHVDHSVPGAYGFIIWTSKGPIAYTGDIRLHGTHSEMTRDFIERAKEAKPIALITEGTRIADEEKQESEKMVYEESKKTVTETDNLVFADFNFKDVDRLRTFFTIAKETGRKFVVKINDAYFLKHLSQDKHLDVPNIDDEDIIIYLPKRGSGKYSDRDYKGNDREFLDLHNAWTAEQIAARPDKVLCAIGFYSFTALIDMKVKPGARYIHSSSEPYNEEQELSQERLSAWIEHFGMQKFQSHCSGHARGKDLLEAVNEINAKRLFPIHTEHPDSFNKVSDNITIVEESKQYNL
ncbi:MAG: MBL fold metallo-hydrolase [Nitrosopumilaceae archaeon]|nr:MBL fold metallo-hydrolase [Nitrosopumilaceae archaeon]NIU01880.1 MBL fold metallo-hydrolase [Nitrosopumilaceae archaeon]NIU88284.1 MBL fold metallo-hydrolase [Nitrosopumilaceae archaeon]NIV66576.1 MBL fold metallo-hydrolase [Nitrosopumilaceae archaeon]NIX62481.1 MBL fold metallo-hydrolase [Nitrosopumilaceae archaeon]